MSDHLDLDAIRTNWGLPKNFVPTAPCETGILAAWRDIQALLAEVERLRGRERRLHDWTSKLLKHHDRLVDHGCDWRVDFQDFDLDRDDEPEPDERDAEIARLTSQLDALQAEHERAVTHARTLQARLDVAAAVAAGYARALADAEST